MEIINRVPDAQPVVGVLCRVVNALLGRFVELVEDDLSATGFVRRGPVFRYFDPEGTASPSTSSARRRPGVG